MYGKVFLSIFTGSLYGQYEATVMMMACVVLSDRDGVLDYTPESLAGATGFPLDVVKEGLKQLQQPEPAKVRGQNAWRKSQIDETLEQLIHSGETV